MKKKKARERERQAEKVKQQPEKRRTQVRRSAQQLAAVGSGARVQSPLGNIERTSGGGGAVSWQRRERERNLQGDGGGGATTGEGLARGPDLGWSARARSSGTASELNK